MGAILKLDRENSRDAVNIRTTAAYCRNRLADTQMAKAWISIGEQLAGLKTRLKKTTPRGDNEHIGWLQAFDQRQSNGKSEFPFKRNMADRCILLHEFFAVNAINSKLQQYLPSSFNALEAIRKYKFTSAQIEKAIEAGEITPASNAANINALVKDAGLVNARKPAQPQGGDRKVKLLLWQMKQISPKEVSDCSKVAMALGEIQKAFFQEHLRRKH